MEAYIDLVNNFLSITDITKRSEDHIATYGLRISASVYICIPISVNHALLGGKGCNQNGTSGSYMDATFKLVVHKESE